MSASFGALGHDQIDAGLGVPPRVLGGAGQRGHHHVVVMGSSDQVGRRRAERAGDQPDTVSERDVQQRFVALRRDVELAGRQALLVGGDRDAIADQQVVDECPVLFGQQLARLPRVDPTLLSADVLMRQQQVDAVRLAVSLFLDPAQLGVQLLRSVRDGAVSAESWAACQRELGADPAVLVELVTAIGAWRMVASILQSLQVPLEDGLASWPPDGQAPSS